MPNKKVETRDIKLTNQQVEKLNLYSAQQAAAHKRLGEYLSGVLDGAAIEGTWDVLGIEGGILKLKEKG